MTIAEIGREPATFSPVDTKSSEDLVTTSPADARPAPSYIFVINDLAIVVLQLNFALKMRTKTQDKKLEQKYDDLTKESAEKQLLTGNRTWQVTAVLSGAQLVGLGGNKVGELVTSALRPFIGWAADNLEEKVSWTTSLVGNFGNVTGPNARELTLFFTAKPQARSTEIQSILQQLNTQMQSSSANQDQTLKDVMLQALREAFDALGRVGR